LIDQHYKKTSTTETTKQAKQNKQKSHSVLIIPNVTPAALAMAVRCRLVDAKTLEQFNQ